jgi:hypothetical protein
LGATDRRLPGIVTWSPTIDPEALKTLSMRMVNEAKVRLLLHAWCVAPIVEDAVVRGAIFESKEGRHAVLAKVVVDTAGDANLIARSGAHCEMDIDTNDIHHCMNKEPERAVCATCRVVGRNLEKDLDRAKSEADIALSLNPSCSGAYLILGHIQTLSGRPLEAIPALERATRLDPAFRPQHLYFLGVAYLLAGKYETAAALLRERILLMPGTDFSRVLLASALGHLGEVDDARRVWQELKEINPKYSFSEHFARQPFKKQEDVQRFAEGLVKAGLQT